MQIPTSEIYHGDGASFGHITMESVEKSTVRGNRDNSVMRMDLFKERLESGTQLWVLALLTSVQEVAEMLP